MVSIKLNSLVRITKLLAGERSFVGLRLPAIGEVGTVRLVLKDGFGKPVNFVAELAAADGSLIWSILLEREEVQLT